MPAYDIGGQRQQGGGKDMPAYDIGVQWQQGGEKDMPAYDIGGSGCIMGRKSSIIYRRYNERQKAQRQ